ncbi:MAG: sulfatase-like hydrolase/transferase, partial [bacterium]|nr:sulfatase-like hydrolase/transferase [bacterium]
MGAGTSALLTSQLTKASGSSRRPNIVIIIGDDIGYSDFGCYGGEIETPNLDRLASGGVRFTRFYVTPRCSPTRAALLTGRYPHEVGIGHLNERWGRPGYRGELAPDVATLAEVLRSNGYGTYMAGKWHLANNPNLDGSQPTTEERRSWPRARGFDRFYGTIRGSGSFYQPASLVRDD